MKKAILAGMGLLALCLFAFGCSNEPGESPQNGGAAVNDPEPIRLKVFNGQPGNDFEKLGVMEALRSKFPHVDFELIVRGTGTNYEDLISGGNLPDLIYEAASFTVERVMHYDFHYDMEGLIKAHNFNLNVFEPNVLAQTQFANSEGKLYGLPFMMNKYALYYNIDLFDKFGVPYPVDGLTWDEVYEIAKLMTRVEEEQIYYGFTAVANNMMLNNQLALHPLHQTEDRAHVNTDGWKLLFENLKRFFEIPNSAIVPTSDVPKGRIAMAIESNPAIMRWATENQDMNWDIVSAPIMKENPGIGFKPATLALFVSKTSPNKDAAFQALAHLVSEEVQTIFSRQGIGTPLTSSAVKSAFGQDIPVLQGKNTGAYYYYPDAPPSPPRSAELTNVGVNFGGAFAEMINQNQDVNTALRQFEEKLNLDIARAKEAK